MEFDNISKPSLDRYVGLQVGNSIFYVSRRDFIDCSLVFKKMLRGKSKESKNEIIDLSEKKREEILELLRCTGLFPCKDQSQDTKPIDVENLESMLQLGHEYKIIDLLNRCLEFIKVKLRGPNRNSTSIKECAKFVELAIQYKNKDIIGDCLGWLSVIKTSLLFADQAFIDLPLNVRYIILLIDSLSSSNATGHRLEKSDGLSYCSSHNELVCGYVCVLCGIDVCKCDCCQRDETCQVCHQCKNRYNENHLVCECIDPIIGAELEKLDLM